MISIIIPVFNAAKYLDRCINSILQQSYGDFELILIDDGSFDGSSEKCDDYASKDRRVIVKHKQNGGVSSARNEGIKIAKGEWLCFFDADDSIPMQSLDSFMAAANKYNPDIVIGNYIEIRENGERSLRTSGIECNKLLDRDGVINKVLINAVMPNGSFGSSWVKMYKHDVFIQYNLSFPFRRRAEDWLLNIRFLEYAQTAVAIDEVVYHYHRNTESTMAKCFPEQFQIWEDNQAIREELIQKYSYDVPERLLASNIINQALWYCFMLINEQKNVRNIILNHFERRMVEDAIKQCNLSHISKIIKPTVIFLKYGFNTLAYYYLKTIVYGFRAKRNITRKI